MRRVRHLGLCNYIVPIGRTSSQLLSLSNYNILLERTWHRGSRSDFLLKAHAKFNANTMNGMQIIAHLEKDGKLSQSVVSEFKIYRVAEASWAETLAYTATPVASSPGVYTATVTQTNLSTNELSGMETYAIEVVAQRKRRRFIKKFWVNHLGCYDNLILLRREIEFLQVTKADD